MIYSLNQKIERVLLLNDNFGQDQKIVSEFTRASKLTILSQINTMIIDVCMSQISEKFNDFSDKIQEKVSNLEEQMKDLQFSLLCKGKSTRSNSIDNKLDKKRQEKIYEKLEESIFSKIQVLNEELEYKFTNKLFTSLEKEIESLKKEIHTQNNESIQLKANINTSNKNSKHERKQSASNIFSDIFTWKKSNSVTLNNLIHDENNAKFNEVFGSDCKEISKVILF